MQYNQSSLLFEKIVSNFVLKLLRYQADHFIDNRLRNLSKKQAEIRGKSSLYLLTQKRIPL